MTLPTNGTPWPPKNLAPVFDLMAEASSWWQGDPRHLDAHFKNRPSQFAGGVVGAASRFFWGDPKMSVRHKMHVPLAADIAHKSASLLFDTAPTFSVADGGGNPQAQERLDVLVNTEQFVSDALVGAESCAALGGVFGKIVWDTSVSDKPWIMWVDADSVIPEWRYGKLVAATFVERLANKDDKHVYRLLSRYSAGWIEYGLYQGEESNLGRIVSLDEHPATMGLMEIVTDGGMVETGAAGTCVAYIPNAMPNVGFRHDGSLRPFGRPDVAPDTYPLLHFLDEAWTSLKRDMRLGASKITLPEYMTRTEGFGHGKSFDPEDEVFVQVKATPDSGVKPELFQPTVRVTEHLELVEGIVRQILQRCNYSPMSFGMDSAGSGQLTAREIEARMRETMQTWKAKSRHWRTGLQSLVTDLVEVDAYLNHTGAELTEPPEIEFYKPTQETMLDRGLTVQALESARAVSTEEKVAMLHPEWDDARRQHETDLILAEQQITIDPMAVTAPDEQVME